MKCCLNSHQTPEYLKKADEIRILYKDRHKLVDYIFDYPDKIFILDMKKSQEIINWDDIKRYNLIAKSNFIIALNDLKDVELCKKLQIKFYWNFPVSTFYDLQALKDLGAEYALIDAPLSHQMNKINNVNIKIRIVPNIAYYAFIPRKDGVCGSWIRPEDLDLYESYIDTIEFEDCDLKKEQALYRIYMEQKHWSGDLGMIITNLNYLGINRMIPKDLAEKRMNCGQKCQHNNSCNLCYRYLNLANPNLLKNIKKGIIE